ncbi:hypothetical protein K435DRAFT_621752, partial [Dendrothele bispora CBS 962.96]
TIISRSPANVLKHIDRFKKSVKTPSASVLFTISPPSNSSDLSDLVDALTVWPNANTIGCITAPTHSDAVTCSIALFDSRKAVPFRSTIPGCEQTQVGRWHSFRKPQSQESSLNVASLLEKREQGKNWDDLWSTGGHEDIVLPEELKSVDPSRVRDIFYFSDRSPEGLSFALNASFPRTNALGLLASSTPFITGRSVTLFHNEHIYDSGAVGIALTNDNNVDSRYAFHLPSGLEALGETMVVTDFEGNLINTLNNANPTQLLLSAIRRAGIDTTSSNAMTFKDDSEFYLATIQSPTKNANEFYQLHSITAGDPSRGTISLNTQSSSPPVGTLVRFFYRPCLIPSTLLNTYAAISDKNPARSTLAFSVAPHSTLSEQNPRVGSHDTNAEPLFMGNTFLAASENGFVLSRRREYSPE